jgi:hypothetical protein
MARLLHPRRRADLPSASGRPCSRLHRSDRARPDLEDVAEFDIALFEHRTLDGDDRETVFEAQNGSGSDNGASSEGGVSGSFNEMLFST